MRAAVYYRVSSKAQEEKESIKTQKLDIRPWLKERMKSSKEFQDDGISGESIDKRPGFKRMLEEIKVDRFDALVVFGSDRIGRFKRAQKGKVMTAIESHLKAMVITDGDEEDWYYTDNEDHMDKLEALLTDARKWNREHARRVRKGLKRRVLNNKPPNGNLPFPLIWSNNFFTYHETELAALKRTMEMARNGSGFDTIAKVLNSEPSKYATRSKKSNPEGKWSPQALWHAVCKSNFLFTGVIESKMHGIEIDTTLRFFTKEEIMDVRSTVKHRNKRRNTRTKTWNFLFRGLAKCGECDKGYTLSVQGQKSTAGRDLRYYRCKNCGTGHNADKVEGEIRRQVALNFGDDERLQWLIQKECFIPKSKRRDLEARLKVINEELSSIAKQRKVAEEFRFNLTWTKEVYEEKVYKLDRRQDSLHLEKQQIENTLAKPGIMLRLSKIASREFAKMIRLLHAWQTDGAGYFNLIKDEIIVTTTPPHEMKIEEPNQQKRDLMFQQEREFYSRLVANGGRIVLTKKKATVQLVNLETLLGNDFDLEKEIIDINLSTATFG